MFRVGFSHSFRRWLPLAGFLLGLSSVSWGQQWTWTAEQVDSSGTFSALAIDTDGNVHAGYMSPEGGGTRYAFRDHNTGRWDSMLVDKNNGFVSLSLDAQQRPHLCYLPYQTLKYASWDGRNWTTQEIAPNSGERDYSCSVAVEANGRVHVIWYQLVLVPDPYYVHIRHAVLTSQGWQEQTLDFGWETGKWNCMRIDEKGRLYVSYSAFKDGAMRYAYTDPQDRWKIVTIEDGKTGRHDATTPGQGNSMVLDKNGNPNFSYRDDVTLRYAWPEGDHWRIDVVDPNANPFENKSWISQRTSLALDANGWPHIAYESDGLLKHAWWDGKRWHVQSMGIRGPRQRYASLAISKDNIIYMGYSDPQSGSFKVLVGRPTQPVTPNTNTAKKGG